MTRTEQVLDLLRRHGAALDDDEIGHCLTINRHYVNQVCRRLEDDGIILREKGLGKKYLNRLRDPDAPPPVSTARRQRKPRVRVSDRGRRNVESIVTDFEACVRRFESSAAFPGPSLYFHERALQQRSLHANPSDLLNDELFLEYVYAVLPAWGMHRMGKQAAKVGDFDEMADSFRSALTLIETLWSRSITDPAGHDAQEVAETAWDVIASLRVSTSNTRIVAGSKALHHVLPELIPPIDRQYTFRFFTGQKAVNKGDETAFLDWFPMLCEIGERCKPQIDEAVSRGGFMATSASKVIDNAIIGFVQRADQAEA